MISKQKRKIIFSLIFSCCNSYLENVVFAKSLYIIERLVKMHEQVTE